MIRITYNPQYWNAVPDGQTRDFVADLIEEHRHHDVNITFSTSNIINQLRLAIKLGEIDWQGIEFVFKNEVIVHDRTGQFKVWPDGFCDYEYKTIAKMIDWDVEHGVQ